MKLVITSQDFKVEATPLLSSNKEKRVSVNSSWINCRRIFTKMLVRILIISKGKIKNALYATKISQKKMEIFKQFKMMIKSQKNYQMMRIILIIVTL